MADDCLTHHYHTWLKSSDNEFLRQHHPHNNFTSGDCPSAFFFSRSMSKSFSAFICPNVSLLPNRTSFVSWSRRSETNLTSAAAAAASSYRRHHCYHHNIPEDKLYAVIRLHMLRHHWRRKSRSGRNNAMSQRSPMKIDALSVIHATSSDNALQSSQGCMRAIKHIYYSHVHVSFVKVGLNVDVEVTRILLFN